MSIETPQNATRQSDALDSDADHVNDSRQRVGCAEKYNNEDRLNAIHPKDDPGNPSRQENFFVEQHHDEKTITNEPRHGRECLSAVSFQPL